MNELHWKHSTEICNLATIVEEAACNGGLMRQLSVADGSPPELQKDSNKIFQAILLKRILHEKLSTVNLTV